MVWRTLKCCWFHLRQQKRGPRRWIASIAVLQVTSKLSFNMKTSWIVCWWGNITASGSRRLIFHSFIFPNGRSLRFSFCTILPVCGRLRVLARSFQIVNPSRRMFCLPEFRSTRRVLLRWQMTNDHISSQSELHRFAIWKEPMYKWLCLPIVLNVSAGIIILDASVEFQQPFGIGLCRKSIPDGR